MKIEINTNGSTQEISRNTEGIVTIPVQNDTQKRALCKIAFDLPMIDVNSIWYPSVRGPLIALPWIAKFESAGQKHIPFFSFMNVGQCNQCAIYSDRWQEDTQVIAKMNQQNSVYEVAVTISLAAGSSANVTLDFRHEPWQKILSEYRDTLYGGTVPEYPEGAWDPVFCSWYAVHAAITQDWIDRNAPLAAAMGFRTFIVDDGWCFDVKKRVTPENLLTWYENIGNWTLSKEKFPDYPAHRERMRKLGLNYIYWVAPFLIGDISTFYREFPDSTIGEYHEGQRLLNPERADMMANMKERIVRVMKDLDLDGLKIDFLDIHQPDIDKPFGTILVDFIRDLTERLKALKKDALIEFRQSYATPGMAPFGTQFRAGDVPFDFLHNFQSLCQIRMTMGDHIPVHADPVYWHPDDLPENISRHMIASLAGVPMLSMELTDMPKRTTAIITRWIKFYRAHQQTLNHGHWDVRYANGAVLFASVTKDAERICICRDGFVPAMLNDGFHGTCRVLNLAGDTVSVPGAAVFDCFGQQIADDVIPAGAEGVFSL